MATQTKTTAKTAAADTTDAVKADMEKGASKIADTTREYVQRTAATAKERTDSAYEGVSKFNNGLEKTMNRFVVGYVGILGEIAEAAHENASRAIGTVEKMSKAKSVSEAAQIQVDYVRENTSANYDRARTAFEATRDVVTEGASTIRESVSDMMPYGKKAA